MQFVLYAAVRRAYNDGRMFSRFAHIFHCIKIAGKGDTVAVIVTYMDSLHIFIEFADILAHKNAPFLPILFKLILSSILHLNLILL